MFGRDGKDLEPVAFWRDSSDPENPTLPTTVSYGPKATLGIVHNILEIAFVFLVLHLFLRQGFSMALEPLLELALGDQARLELPESRLPLPLKYWD